MARTPRYREIADHLRQRLARGEWPVGNPLPGISALQAEYGVAGLNTIRQAQAILQEEGLLEARQGSGTFVIALPDRDAVDRAELRGDVTEMQGLFADLQAVLARIARRLEQDGRADDVPDETID